MKASTTLCLITSIATITALPTNKPTAINSSSPAIKVVFNNVPSANGRTQTLAVMWPIDSKFYTPSDIAPAIFPAAQSVIGGSDSSGSEDAVGRVTCTFAGRDGSTHSVDNFSSGQGKEGDVDGSGDGDRASTPGAPTEFTSGECHFVG